jgi:16S rRNA (uracil1498-N3)-methyltransferase
MSRTPRVFVHDPLATGQRIRLADEAAAHLGRVLRVRPGDAVVLFDGSGPEFVAEVLAVGRRGVELTVRMRVAADRESALQLVLLQGICRKERMDWVVRKATELGVSAIRPVLAERSVVRLGAARAAARMAHWRAIAISACEQCGRNRLPGILEPLPVRDALEAHAGTLGVLLDAESDAGLEALPERRRSGFSRESGSGFSRDVQDALSICLLVGPEGGLDERERAAAHAAGYLGIRLGPRILRTETAALTGIALLQARFGDLG